MAVGDTLKKALSDWLNGEVDGMVAQQDGGDGQQVQSQLIEQKAILTDPYYDHAAQSYYMSRNKISRVSNKTLRDMSMRDWLVNTILQIRADTVIRFSRPQHKKFEMGYQFSKDDGSHVEEADSKIIHQLEQFILNCGYADGTPRGQEMTFSDFLKLTTWDALTYGHISIEKVLTRDGSLHRFRPLPGETVYRVNPQMSRQLMAEQVETGNKMYRQKRSDNDPIGDGVISDADISYYKYVQMSSDNRPLMVFGDEDMVFKLFNPKNFPDSNGYAISMVEQAIIMVTNHLNVEAYNANFFTQGYAARGILHLKGTVTQNTLASFRRQFYNTISGSNNAWRTPIVAGLDDVQWVPMSGSAKEMEYINFNSHIMRSLCSQFQIDPIEVGLDYLTSANGRGSAQGKESGQFKITYSRERGLVPILMFFEDFINTDIMPAFDKELAKKYKFKFTGFTDETAQTDVALRQAQMSTFATMNDLLKFEDRAPITNAIASVPLNQSFWGLVEKNMTRGEIREQFFGDVGATQRPELQYIPGDPAFLQWQNMMLTIKTQEEQKKQMADQQQQAQQQQAQQAQQEQQQSQQEGADKDRQHQLKSNKDARDQQAHEREQSAHDSAGASAAVRAGQGQSPVQALQEAAKQFGVTGASHEGGTVGRNPINVAADAETPEE